MERNPQQHLKAAEQEAKDGAEVADKAKLERTRGVVSWRLIVDMCRKRAFSARHFSFSPPSSHTE